MISHCGFALHFPNDYQYGAPFHGHLGLFSFEKYLFSSSAHFFKWTGLSCVSSYYILDTNPYLIYDLQIFSPTL